MNEFHALTKSFEGQTGNYSNRRTGEWMGKIIKIFQISVSREMQSLLHLKNIAFIIPWCLDDCWEHIKPQLTPAFNHFKHLDIFKVFHEKSIYVSNVWAYVYNQCSSGGRTCREKSYSGMSSFPFLWDSNSYRSKTDYIKCSTSAHQLSLTGWIEAASSFAIAIIPVRFFVLLLPWVMFFAVQRNNQASFQLLVNCMWIVFLKKGKYQTESVITRETPSWVSVYTNAWCFPLPWWFFSQCLLKSWVQSWKNWMLWHYNHVFLQIIVLLSCSW